MENFFKKIGQTFYSKELYLNSNDSSVTFGLKFLFKFLILASVIFGILFFFISLSFIPKIKNQTFQYIETSYPNDLIISIKDKILSTNTNETISFPLTQEIKNENVDNQMRKNMLVLAPIESITDIELFTKYDTYAIATSKNFMVQNENLESRIYPFNFPNTDINKGKVINFIKGIYRIIVPMILVFSIPMILMFFIGFTIKNLLTLFFVSFILFLIFKFLKINLTYKEIYRMGVYALVPVFILNILLFLFALETFWINVFAIMTILLLVFKSKEKDPILKQEVKDVI